ncbi:damage-control phosphatase ARMT1 family protein [Desulfobacula phenolica]|uniref:Damage-control phosphatase ARMT1-like metal-binding domain-containing protein n=1 Tax=Desulfobacula phenolica TaxID=90732 RepID=A0A1H2K5G3_9BACT|nr:ARMT1-like domain-containing protein [Desulfobacula phenolica]SDU63940.1 hypothetical protein SAMN04487931_12119 [Desulfobacula phenolica]
MKVEEECIPCVLKMSLNGLRSLNLEPYKLREIYHEFVKSIMTQNDIWDITSAELVEKILIKLIDKTGVADPFITIKEKANSQLLSIYDKLKDHVLNCDDPILMATKLSIFGNTIDIMLSDNPENNLKKVLLAYTKEIPLNTESYQKFSSQLKNSKSLLLIADNAGEAVMDKLLIETLKEKHHMEMYYAVRNSPALNDITYDETVDIGFPDIAQVITNGIAGPLPGTMLSRCSQKFLNVLNSVDMVIVKGGGNFESLIGETNLPLNTFFLLMCKCEVHSRFFNSPVGQAILWVN